MSLDVLLIMPPYRLTAPFKYQMLDPPAAWRFWRRSSAGRLLGPDPRRLRHEMSYEEMLDEIAVRQPRTIGICNRSTYSYPMVCKSAKMIKERWPDITVFVGGPTCRRIPKAP